MPKITALILAGSRQNEQDRVAQAASATIKALAKIGTLTMIERVINALQGSGTVENIIVSLPGSIELKSAAPTLAASIENKDILIIEPDRSPATSILKIIKTVELNFPLLITTADHALLTPAIVRQCVEQYKMEKYDAATAMLPLFLLTQKYPHIKRTRLKFKDGAFKACNLFIFKDRLSAERILDFWKKMESQRKKPWRMALILGIRPLIRYSLGLMTLDEAFRKIDALTGTQIQPIMLDIPEAALDVDTPEDLALIRSLAQENV